MKKKSKDKKIITHQTCDMGQIPRGLITFLKNITFLLNYMIIKKKTWKIEHQSNAKIFVWDYNNLIESKPKQIMKLNS